MTVCICDRCGKQIAISSSYKFRVCFDLETVLEKDVCKDCRKSLIDNVDTFFEKEEKHVGNRKRP